MAIDKKETEENPILLATSIRLRNETRMTSWVVNPYLKAATSDNTRKAYRHDVRHYENWGGKLPATPENIVEYLQAFAMTKNARTLARRLVALRHWHTYQGFPDPTLQPIVKKTLMGIIRVHGRPKEKAPPLSPDDLEKMVAALSNQGTLRALRDSTLLQIGFFGGLRRSEIIAIEVEHIEWKPEGIEILLPQSKTDQMHEGQYCAIPYGNDRLCPVKTLKQWLEMSHIKTGAVFRRIRHQNTITETALTPLSVNHIIKRCAHIINLTYADKISSHSLRRGLATSAARANTPVHVIMRAGRWKQVNTVMEYIDANQRLTENAAAHILMQFADQSNE